MVLMKVLINGKVKHCDFFFTFLFSVNLFSNLFRLFITVVISRHNYALHLDYHFINKEDTKYVLGVSG